MADTRITVTSQFRRHGASAKIVCRGCGHFVLVTPAIIELMFPKPLPLSWAHKRLRCTRCGTKGKGEIEPICPAGR